VRDKVEKTFGEPTDSTMDTSISGSSSEQKKFRDHIMDDVRAMERLFDPIRAYHERLGYPKQVPTGKELTAVEEELVVRQHRELTLALFMEVAEITNSAPWKPWRAKTADMDQEHMAEELVDLLFFISSMMENWGIDYSTLVYQLHKKHLVNQHRIDSGITPANINNVTE
jgi:NTP pyrophosphatase (non-canonical NTP hydrolase)